MGVALAKFSLFQLLVLRVLGESRLKSLKSCVKALKDLLYKRFNRGNVHSC